MVVKNIVVFFVFSVSAVLLFSCSGKENESARIPIESFLFKSEKSQFKLSPDGKMIAYLGMHDHCKNIFVRDLEDSTRSRQLTYQDDFNVQNFQWVNDEVIVFANLHSPADSLRIYAVNLQSEAVTHLITTRSSRMRFLRPSEEVDTYVYAVMNARDSAVFDLYKIFLDGRSPELAYENSGNIVSWIPSHDGQIRIALASDDVQQSLLYRRTESEKFRRVVTYDFNTTFRPMGVVGTSLTRILALSDENRDKQAIVEYDVSSGKEIREVVCDEKIDANFEGYSRKNNSLLFATTALKEKQYYFFDEKVKVAHTKLAEQFAPYQIDFVDISTDRENYIIKVHSDVHAGELYHYDLSADKALLLTATYPDLSGEKLLPMESVSYNARDNRTINGFITYPEGKRKNCPVVVLIHDGPNGRDKWEFHPEVQFLANRGYAVFQVNYRGSLGYGKDFRVAGFKEWGGRIQSDITDGVTWLIHEGIANKDRIAIMGTGFGGYAALHAACFNPSLYAGVISSSGYSNFFTFFREVPPHHKRYLQMYYQILGNPEKETDLFRAISPVFHAEKVRRPVLYFQGGQDRYSSVTDANQFVAKLKQNRVPVRYVFKEDEGKQFMKEENVVLYYQEIESFLDNYLRK